MTGGRFAVGRSERERGNPDRDDALESAAALLEAMAEEGAVAPTDAMGCARRLQTVLDVRFSPRRLLVEHPVEMRQDNG